MTWSCKPLTSLFAQWLLNLSMSVQQLFGHHAPFGFCRKFNATDVRTLRAAVSTFCDLLALVTRTLEMFGPNSEFAQ